MYGVGDSTKHYITTGIQNRHSGERGVTNTQRCAHEKGKAPVPEQRHKVTTQGY
jgi:isocitrate lyase